MPTGQPRCEHRLDAMVKLALRRPNDNGQTIMVKRRRGQTRLEAVHEEEEVVTGAAADQLRRQLRVRALAAGVGLMRALTPNFLSGCRRPAGRLLSETKVSD